MFPHNMISLTGNLGGDPEVRHFESGTVKARFSLAVYSGKDKPSQWFDVEAWGKTAERVAQVGCKGCRVSIAGSLKQERWQTDGGASRSKVVVNAESFNLLAKVNKGAPSGQGTEADYDDIAF